MSMTKRYYLWQSALLTLLVGGAGGLLYFSLFPHHYFSGYPFIPVFFFMVGVFGINMVEMCRRMAPARLAQVYLLVRVLRMLLAIVVLAVYGVAVRVEVRAFMLTFVANYLIYLVYDSWFFLTFEVNRKQKKKKEKNETNA